MTCCGKGPPLGAEQNPVPLGEDDGQPARELTVRLGFGGMVWGQTGWFVGDEVDVMLAEGYLEEIDD